MKKFIALLSAFSLSFSMFACGEESDSSVAGSSSISEISEEEIVYIETSDTTEQVNESHEPVSEISLDSRYYGNYMSIGISENWEQHTAGSYSYTYDVWFDIPSNGKMYIYTSEISYKKYANNEDFITNEVDLSKDTLYTNANSIEFIKRTVTNGTALTAFNCYNQNYRISIQFSEDCAESFMFSIIDSFKFENEPILEPTSEQVIESPATTTKASSSESYTDEEPEHGTSEYVDYLALKAKEDAQSATDEQLQEAVDWLKNNTTSYFSGEENMEKTMYYGELLEYKYKDTGNEYEEIGWQAFKTVKYVYRGVETVLDDSTHNNLLELQEMAENLPDIK